MGNDPAKKITVEDILNKKFLPALRGYDSRDVDRFFDAVCRYLEELQKNYAELSSYNDTVEQRVRSLMEKNTKLERENASLARRLDGVKDNGDVNLNNIDLINRVARLENELWKMGGDPNKIK